MQNKLDQFMADAGKLLETTATMYPDLFDGDPPVGINTEAWERYQSITRCLVAAKAAGGWNVLQIRYNKSPSLTEDYAAVIIKMEGACSFFPMAKTALALAAAVSDDVSATMDGGKTWLNFVVDNILENGGIE